ncbi:T9SS type A sorting domain-containing protein, partial [candidate division KSB1 bacterium]|nr:T9SS type A sorting domain-containing protein [candidate division KSB1 bacterium]
FPPRDLAEHREFLHTFLDWLVKQIHFPPARIILEPMNEPDYPALGFWENGTLNDIAAVSRVAYQAAKAVDARIQVIGPSEALGTTITEKLMREYNGAQYFDGLAWHYYGVNFAPVYDRVNSLKSFGLPLFLTEFGNFDYSNEELAGVLWHSYILAEIWQRAPELQPIQFTLTSFPTGLDEKNIFRLALQTDWRYQWERRPAFQIYQNFWHLFRGTTRVNSMTNAELNLIAARNPAATDPATLFLWMTNPTNQNYNVNFKINDFPSEQARILVRSNLDSTIAVDSLAALGTPLRFMHYLPAYTSVRMESRAFLPSSAQTDQSRPELKTLHLAQNYPNPFNPITRIDFYLPEATQITLNIFDLNGTLVRRLISGQVSTKFSSLTWDGLNQHGLPVTSGIYFYQLKTNKMQITKKLMLIR